MSNPGDAARHDSLVVQGCGDEAFSRVTEARSLISKMCTSMDTYFHCSRDIEKAFGTAEISFCKAKLVQPDMDLASFAQVR